MTDQLPFDKSELQTGNVRCSYCGKSAKLVRGAELYPNLPALEKKWFYRCIPCNAHVGCHAYGHGQRPLGRLANAKLRKAKMQAHAAFDPIWQSWVDDGIPKFKARNAAYKWLAEQLKIPRDLCHIGLMSIHQCGQVVEICLQERSRKLTGLETAESAAEVNVNSQTS